MDTIEEYEKLITNNSVNDQLLQHNDELAIHYLYQYRNLDGFWSIIKNDCIWARNIRFSNDEQERKQGIEILKEFYKTSNTETINEQNDYYMICFCKEDDILSQWRGYAPDGGVSMCFEINNQLPFKIIANEDELDIVSKPHKVIYLDKNDKTECELIFNELFANENRTSPSNDPKENILSLIPYLKDKGFDEEKEWRIIINDKFNGIDPLKLKKFINFQKLDHLELPYIKIKTGNSIFDNKQSVVKIQIYEDYLRQKIIKLLKINCKSSVRIVDCFSGYPNKLDCFACTRKIKLYDTNSHDKIIQCRIIDDYIGINASENCIVISQGYDQKEVFELIEKILLSVNEQSIKIWCEGHLPIKSVTVGPCENRDYVAENIKNYFKNSENYWLRYVDVKKSKIPYRSKLK